jgi:hypothetical protein
VLCPRLRRMVIALRELDKRASPSHDAAGAAQL